MATLSPDAMQALRRLASEELTTDVPFAGSCFGIGSNLSYELVQRGEFPVRVIRLGKKLRVPTADLLRALGLQ